MFFQNQNGGSLTFQNQNSGSLTFQNQNSGSLTFQNQNSGSLTFHNEDDIDYKMDVVDEDEDRENPNKCINCTKPLNTPDHNNSTSSGGGSGYTDIPRQIIILAQNNNNAELTKKKIKKLTDSMIYSDIIIFSETANAKVYQTKNGNKTSEPSIKLNTENASTYINILQLFLEMKNNSNPVNLGSIEGSQLKLVATPLKLIQLSIRGFFDGYSSITEEAIKSKPVKYFNMCKEKVKECSELLVESTQKTVINTIANSITYENCDSLQISQLLENILIIHIQEIIDNVLLKDVLIDKNIPFIIINDFRSVKYIKAQLLGNISRKFILQTIMIEDMTLQNKDYDFSISQKYLKYKNKYLQLKNKYIQLKK